MLSSESWGYLDKDVRNLYRKYSEIRTKAGVAVERGDISLVAFYVTLLWGVWVGSHLDDVVATEKSAFFIRQMREEPTLHRVVRELTYLDALFSQYVKEN